MTATSIPHGGPRPVARDSAPHLFAVGQAVRLKAGFNLPSTRMSDTFHITGTLPPSGGSPQYRIRNDDERYERVTKEDCLEPVAALNQGAFGHGEKTEPRPAREPKPEAAKRARKA